jgi:hypothetical protein
MPKFDQFHDGYFDGLLIKGATVRVFLRTHGGQEFVLEVIGVSSMKADGFRQGNIIFDVLLRRGDDLTVGDIICLYELEEESKALAKLEEARRKNLVVLEINPSYGASCTILAESVELVPPI